jgi:hypothetical protein
MQIQQLYIPIKQNQAWPKWPAESPSSAHTFLEGNCNHLSSPTHLYFYCLFGYIEFGLHQVWLYELSGNLACLVHSNLQQLHVEAEHSIQWATATLQFLIMNIPYIGYLVVKHSSSLSMCDLTMYILHSRFSKSPYKSILNIMIAPPWNVMRSCFH